MNLSLIPPGFSPESCAGRSSGRPGPNRERRPIPLRKVPDLSIPLTETHPGSTRSQSDDDYLTVTLLSAGLALLLEQRAQAGTARPNDGLLPAPWRLGAARLWWRWSEHGLPAPKSDLELMFWCSKPLSEWPIALGLSARDLQYSLVVGEELSPLAEQAARFGTADVEAEWQERRIYRALRTAATANGDNDDEINRSYAALRRLLIDRPVLTDLEVKRWERRFPAVSGSGQTHLQNLIMEAYLSWPAAGPQQYVRCRECRNKLSNHAAPCRTPGCPAGGTETVTVAPLAVIHEQSRAARRFIHDPGLVEARIMDSLDDLSTGRPGLRITPYPRLDTLDLLVEFVDTGSGTVLESWGIDAKDRASARLLGRDLAWPESFDCSQRFLAVPEHRASVPGYLEDLRAELEGRSPAVEVIDEVELLRLARRTVRRLLP